MNAQTAAVLDFQKPLNVATSPKTFKIHVASFISEEQEFKLRLRFYSNLKMFQHYQKDAERAGVDIIQKYRCFDTADRYKEGAIALIDGLHIVQAIDGKEHARLSALFVTQPDLFECKQAA